MEQSVDSALPVKMILTSWQQQNKSFDKLLNDLPEEQLRRPVAPGKNSGHYLLGHLVAVHDAMLPLLGLGQRLYPELEEMFIINPDRIGAEYVTIPELKKKLALVNERLNHSIASMSMDDWMQRHSAVKAEDFEKEPHRNKLNIMISRTSHLAYHLGQLVLLKQGEN